MKAYFMPPMTRVASASLSFDTLTTIVTSSSGIAAALGCTDGVEVGCAFGARELKLAARESLLGCGEPEFTARADATRRSSVEGASLHCGASTERSANASRAQELDRMQA